VVVINFLNERNEADRRVYELLEQKFNLFTGVFGASDDVLGSIESGVDFERRVLDIYQQRRTAAEIQTAFETLQSDLDEQIQTRMRNTRKLLLENFDEDVHERLKVNIAGARKKLDRIGRLFWMLTRHVLKDISDFDDETFCFTLNVNPVPDVMTGQYHLVSKKSENIPGEYLNRLGHPLGEHVVLTAKNYPCPLAEVTFDITGHPTRIAVVQQIKEQSGWMRLQHLRIESFDCQEYLLFSAFNDTGKSLDQETCEKLFLCNGTAAPAKSVPASAETRLDKECTRHIQATIAKNLEENSHHFHQTRDQLDKWAEDMEMAVQKDLDDIKTRIREAQRRSRQAPTLEEQHEIQEQIAGLERKKRLLRQRIFDIEDEIADKRDRLVSELEKRMMQKTTCTPVFTIRWKVR